MVYTFKSINQFISEIEVEILDMLYDYQLLTKFSPDVKKIIMYVFINRFGEVISDSSLLFYHSKTIDLSHELCSYFPIDALTKFINRICDKLRKVTNRIFYIKENTDVPAKCEVDELDGSIQDELILLNYKDPINPKNLKSFLSEHNLTDMFTSLAKKVY